MAAALAVAACGGGHSGHGGHTHSSLAARPTTGTATGPASSSAAGPQPAVAPIEGVFDAGVDGQQIIRLTVYDLRRVGPFVQLDFSIACAREPTNACSPDAALAHDQNHVSETPDGITLVDPTGDTQYLPVTDGRNRVDGTVVPGLLDVGARPVLSWVRFKAPPASVSSLDVLFPNGGPQLSSVPVATGGAAPVASQIPGGAIAAPPSAFDQPPSAATTAGLNLPVLPLILSVGGRTGSARQAGAHTRVTLSSDVLFAFGKARLSPRAHAIIAAVAGRLKGTVAGEVAVDGYTDSIGTDAVNLPLSRRRAAAVAGALRAITGGGIRGGGIRGGAITYRVAGHGSADPVAPNTTSTGADNPAGRRLNRRVTISYRVKVRQPPQAPPQVGAGAPPATAGPRTVTFRAVTPNNGTSTYTITADALYRVGNLAVLRFTARCQSPDGCDATYDFAGTTDDVPPLAADTLANHSLYNELDKASGVYLTDPGSGLSYAPVSAGQGLYEAGPATLTVGINPNKFGSDPWPMWGYFPAPPATVSSLNVVMPGGAATIKGMPISSAPPSP